MPHILNFLLVLCVLTMSCGLARADDAAKVGKKTPGHQTKSIEGWTVLVSDQLLEKEKDATARALELLTVQLQEITRVVPEAAVVELRKVPLWFSPEYPGVQQRAEYHPGAGWLRDNKRNPAMEKAVEFTNVRIFERETRRMPNFALHELAHAYHDRVLPNGFGNEQIKAAFENAKAKGLYEKVEQRFGNGRSANVRAYAITNPMEYFAECTEAFYSTNDFFPFTRKQLEKHDPTMYALLKTLWGPASDDKATGTSNLSQPSRPQSTSKKSARSERYDASVPKPTVAGIPYGDHERNIIDFWKADSSTPTPLVFVIHGGGWQGGSKERVHRFADVATLLKAGISVTALNYRYVRQGVEAGIMPPVKAPLHDAARALQFVRSKAKEWNIDKERVGAAGGSAGACSSLWLAFHDDLADVNSDDPVARESTRLQCAAVIGAQTTLDPRQMKEWTPNSKYGGHAFGLPGFPKFLAERDNILPWIAEYSPYALVTKDDPPVYLMYSAPPALGQDQRDPTHTSNFGVKLQEHCEVIGVDCELVHPKAPDVKHADPTEYLIKTLKSARR